MKGCLAVFAGEPPPLTSQAVTSLIDRTSPDVGEAVDDILRIVTALPAPPLLHRVPAVLELRYGCLLRDALLNHVQSEQDAVNHPSFEAIQRATTASRFLWALTPALLRYPASGDMSKCPDNMHTSFAVIKIVKQRLQLAESCKWMELLRDYQNDLVSFQTTMEQNFTAHSLSEPVSIDKLHEKCVSKVKQGNLHAAKNILCGQTCAPLDAATASQVDGLVAVDTPVTELGVQEQLFDEIRKTTTTNKLPKMRSVRRRLYAINLGAEAGPSGMRNSHITCLLKVFNGLVALQKWVGMWKSGSLQPETSALWTASVVVPIDCGAKPDGSRKLRPIALTEHLLKASESIIIDDALAALRAAFEPHQLGTGTADGNVLIYRILQAWLFDIEAHGNSATCEPGSFLETNGHSDVMVGLDMENAYGRFLRSAAIRGLNARVPELARLVHAVWGQKSTTYWQRVDGAWRAATTARGGWQGSRWAMLLFCFALEDSMDAMPEEVQSKVTRVGYQDDTYLVGNAFVSERNWGNICAAFEAGGHKLNSSKTCAYLPCWVGTPTDQLPAVLQSWFACITRSTQGLATMGCAAQGSCESVLGPFQYALHAARKRIDKASVFYEKLLELMCRCADEASLHAAWLLTAKSLNQTLCYDARLLPLEVVACVTSQLGSMVRRAAGRIAGCTISSEAWEQVQLPGPLGGMGLRLAESSAHAAYLSTWISCASKVGLLCSQLSRPTACSVGREAAIASQQALRINGVAVRLDGEVSFTDESAGAYAAGPWSKDCSPSSLFSYSYRSSSNVAGSGTKLHARIMRGLEALQATGLHARLPPYCQTVMLSCGGSGAGKFWSTMPGRADHFMDNMHFRMAMCMRLGMVSVPAGAVCQIPKASEGGEHCLCSLETEIVHPYLCKAGPARLRPHRSLAETLAREAKKLGAHVDLERACPDLYQVRENGHITEAILDVVYHLPGGPRQRKIDVTIRCPFAQRYADTSTVGGVAAACGVSDKLARYGPSVLCLSFETFGRMSAESMTCLRDMAADFEHRVTARLPGRRLYDKWRMSLERALYFEMADMVLLSLGHSSGLHRRRPSPDIPASMPGSSGQ